MGNRSISLDVDAPPRSVFALYVDPRRWSEWQPAARNRDFARLKEIAEREAASPQ